MQHDHEIVWSRYFGALASKACLLGSIMTNSTYNAYQSFEILSLWNKNIRSYNKSTYYFLCQL